MAIYITSIVSDFILLYFFIVGSCETFYKSKINKLKKICITFVLILSSLLIEFLSNVFNQPLLFAYIFPLSLIYTKILRIENKYTMLSIIISFLIMFFNKTMTNLILKLDNYTSYSQHLVSNNILKSSLPFILSILLIFSIIKLTNKFRGSIKRILDNIDNKDILAFALFILCIISPILLHFYYRKLSYEILLIIAILTSCVILYKYEYFLISAKFKINQSEKNTRRLCKIIDDLKIVKHDYSNILQTLNGYVITKQYDDLEKHIKRLINESKQINFTELINPNVFNQPAVYGIIDSKYFDALEKNIKVNVDVATNIREINFDFIDLSRVLGILLDNAIEASEKTQSKEMSIEFTYNPKKEADIIEIKNSINPNANIDINKIFNKGASSKKKKSGLGLWEVKNIISSTSNSKIYTNINDTTFSQTIVIEKS